MTDIVPTNDPGDELDLPEEEYEEISSDEVDRVVAALEELMDTVASENVRMYLEDALNNVFYLVYDESDVAGDEEFDDSLDEAA